MKFSLSWLKTFLDTDADAYAIADRLTMIGLEVENLEDPKTRLAALTTARILETRPHPQADRLKVCRVETASGICEVVCGAPNAQAGLIGIYAAPGVVIPSSGERLKAAKIRGVKSEGMLCSGFELGISDDHDGIIDLRSDGKSGSSAHPMEIGIPAAQALDRDDPVFDVAVTPNRGDAFGIYGIARDLAASGLGTLKPDALSVVRGTFGSPLSIRLEFGDLAPACPAFAGRYFRGIKNGPSPEWLQRRLLSIGLRPINCLVDITNFMTHAYARPLHVYDAKRLKADAIIARFGRKGESFAALDGKSYSVRETDCVIATEDQVLGLGGVIGGTSSGCETDTTDVFLESAWFDPARTASTGRHHGLVTDARMRFERVVDPSSLLPGLERASAMIVQLCGGEASEVVFAGRLPDADRIISFSSQEVERLTGLDVDFVETCHHLRNLGFTISGTETEARALPPSYRPDIEGAADLVEEVVRMVGLENLPSVPLPPLEQKDHALGKAVETQAERLDGARALLAGRGLVEAITWSFTDKESAERFGGGDPSLKIVNPIAQDKTDMRPHLLPGLLKALSANRRRGHLDVNLFEVGQVFLGPKAQDMKSMACGLRSGTALPSSLGRHFREGLRRADFLDVKGDLALLLEAMGGLSAPPLTRDAPPWYHPGRSGTFRLGAQVLGHFGEAHPDLDEAFGLRGAKVVLFELWLDALPSRRHRKSTYHRRTLMPIRRDFSFVISRETPVERLLSAVRKADRDLIEAVRVFDLFEDKSLKEKGQRAIALEVVLCQRDRILKDADLGALSEKIVASAAKAAGACLR